MKRSLERSQPQQPTNKSRPLWERFKSIRYINPEHLGVLRSEKFTPLETCQSCIDLDRRGVSGLLTNPLIEWRASQTSPKRQANNC